MMYAFKKPFRRAAGISIFFLLTLPYVYAEPVTLDDFTLNQVTAGTDSSTPGGSGGAIIGNSSEATINQTGGVDLSGEAQSGAEALNLVNTAESTVANVVNIWDIDSADTSIDGSELMVDQSNIITQEQRRSASMPNYSRPEANTFVQVDRTGVESHDDNINRNNTVIDIHELSSEAQNASWSSVDTTIAGGGTTNADPNAPNPLPASPAGSVDTNVGKGLAIAGQLDASIDGGEAHIGLAVGGSVIAHPDLITPTTSGEPSDSFGGIDVGNDSSQLTLYGRLILPDLSLTINGSGCGVVMGSCDAGGTADLASSETIDQSIMDTDVSSSVGNSSFTENITETYRSPFELNNAQAEYIVVDDSSLTVSTTFNLALSDSAQSNVRAMNVVNATGSAVADGVNIARTSGLTNGGAMSLQQTNIIAHSR